MSSKLYLLSSCTLLSHFAWAQTSDLPTPRPTLVIEAQHSSDSLVNSSASTKFKHDAIDVPFSRSFISKETLKQ